MNRGSVAVLIGVCLPLCAAPLFAVQISKQLIGDWVLVGQFSAYETPSGVRAFSSDGLYDFVINADSSGKLGPTPGVWEEILPVGEPSDPMYSITLDFYATQEKSRKIASFTYYPYHRRGIFWISKAVTSATSDATLMGVLYSSQP